jgi:PII-like signaling protein
VIDDCLKLTTYFSERDRVGDAFLADALSDVYERHALRTSLVIRGAAGFGAEHHLRTDRQLTQSENLPLVSVAVDARERIEIALADVEALATGGLVTLERARMLTGSPDAVEQPREVKLTVYLGRRQRIAGRPAYDRVVDLLRRRGAAGATVLLGVDGTAYGERRRATFFGRNADVPLMVISVGDGDTIAGLLPELAAMLTRPLVTLERVTVCKRDGKLLAGPPEVAPGVWQKLMVYAGEQARHDGRPLYTEIVRTLREAGAAGATSMRGIWGFHGDHEPHGDTFWSLRRRVPVLTVLVDTPERIRDWFAVIDELTTQTGLVTCEMVPWVRTKDAPRAGGRARTTGSSGTPSPSHG